MEFNQEDFDQLEALLNFPPEAPFHTIGEVGEHLISTGQLMYSVTQKHLMAEAAVNIVGGVLADSWGPMSPEAVGLQSLGLFVDALAGMVVVALERDMALMASFIEAAGLSGS